MKICAFIGSYDKTDMLTYIAKILNLLNKKVIIIDSTVLQKSKYIIPKMQSTKQFITTYEGIDYAVGFENAAQVKAYQTSIGGGSFDYDIALIDIDTARGYKSYGIKPTDIHYFVSSLDIYCLKRGLQVFKHLENQVPVTKVLFSKNMQKQENEYVNFLSKELKVKWNDEIIYFPFENGDQTVIYSHQRTGRIGIQGLSQQYIENIMYISEEISEASPSNIKKAIKIIDRN